MQNAPVLVLNRSWVAINVTTVRRALTLVLRDHAHIVSPVDYTLYDFDNWCSLSHFHEQHPDGPYIRTPNLRIRLPEVILLSVFNGFQTYKIRLSRRNLFERDQHTCQYCGRRLPKSELTIDHVLPRSRGGKDTWENLVLACSACNTRKSNRTPKEAHMRLRKLPTKPKWLPQFNTPLPPNGQLSWQRFIDLAYWNTEFKE